MRIAGRLLLNLVRTGDTGLFDRLVAAGLYGVRTNTYPRMYFTRPAEIVVAAIESGSDAMVQLKFFAITDRNRIDYIVTKLGTDDNVANILTKALDRHKVQHFVQLLGLRSVSDVLGEHWCPNALEASAQLPLAYRNTIYATEGTFGPAPADYVWGTPSSEEPNCPPLNAFYLSAIAGGGKEGSPDVYDDVKDDHHDPAVERRAELWELLQDPSSLTHRPDVQTYDPDTACSCYACLWRELDELSPYTEAPSLCGPPFDLSSSVFIRKIASSAMMLVNDALQNVIADPFEKQEVLDRFLHDPTPVTKSEKERHVRPVQIVQMNLPDQVGACQPSETPSFFDPMLVPWTQDSDDDERAVTQMYVDFDIVDAAGKEHNSYGQIRSTVPVVSEAMQDVQLVKDLGFEMPEGSFAEPSTPWIEDISVMLESTEPVIRLTCLSQCYDWGKVGTASKVAELAAACSTFECDKETPYAELWMGTHPNGASKTIDTHVPLKDLLNEQNLGKKIFAEYGGDLPFLFKVLSIRKALSIQAHPDKVLAADLHKNYPEVYKDPNHKPEMAVALTPFEAFINFRPLHEIADFLRDFPEFRALVGEETAAAFTTQAQGKCQDDETENKDALRALFQKLMESKQVDIAAQLDILIARLHDQGLQKKGGIYELVDRLNTQFPHDVGSFCAFLLNYVQLSPGESIFLAANEPHAYLSGDCVECMAASDNVIRSGLTPKFKDVSTLVKCLTYNHGPADTQIMRGEPYKGSRNSTLYDPPIAEFSILRTTLDAAAEEKVAGVQGPSILIVTSGDGTLEFTAADGKKVKKDAKRGYIFFIAAGADVSLAGSSKDTFTSYRAFCE
ncbi:Mannose-6-phosphate isomerase [Thoreauomyces humboldtii]|nr:Mannose-6-phosphate isomerase [Thoreauomyces humboldtii]